MLIYGRDAEVADWVGRKLGISFHPPYAAIGIERAGEALAGVVYNGFEWPNIHVTFVTTSPRWASRQVIGRLLSYPFCELKCRRVTATTGSKNQTARSFLCRLGFILEGYHPGLFPDDDGVSYGLHRDVAERWIRGGIVVQGPQRANPAEPLSGLGRPNPE